MQSTTKHGPVQNSPCAFGRVQPTTTATLVRDRNTERKMLYIQNVGSIDVYVGGLGVTINTGMLLPKMYTNVDTGQREIAEWQEFLSSDAIYAITASGTADLRYREVTEGA